MNTLTRLVLLTVCCLPLAAAEEPYHFIKEIHIGGAGGWDYITVDAERHRAYASHSTKVVVIDTETGAIVGEVPDLAGVHGMAIAADLGRGFTSNGRDNTSTIVDLKTLETIGKVATGGKPDAILYDPARREVYTFNATGLSATVFDATGGKVVATIDLGGKPEAAVVDTAAHRVFVNIEDKAAIAVIDTESKKVVGTFALPGCEEPTGLAYAQAEHRLFSACHSGVLKMVDSVSGKVVGTTPIGGGVDGAVYDTATKYVFTSNGEGTVTIAHLDSADKLTVVQTLKTAPLARTMALDPITHRIYLSGADSTPAAVPGARPTPVADTFKVLVYGPR